MASSSRRTGWMSRLKLPGIKKKNQIRERQMHWSKQPLTHTNSHTSLSQTVDILQGDINCSPFCWLILAVVYVAPSPRKTISKFLLAACRPWDRIENYFPTHTRSLFPPQPLIVYFKANAVVEREGKTVWVIYGLFWFQRFLFQQFKFPRKLGILFVDFSKKKNVFV